MIPKNERMIRKAVSGAGKLTKAALDTHGWLTSPHTKMAEHMADRMIKADDIRKIRGAQRHRAQYLDTRTKKWVKIDTRTGKPIKRKKTYGPFKNIRKINRRF